MLCPPTLKERESPLLMTPQQSGFSLLDLNLATSVPGNYCAPPTPMLYDAVFVTRGTHPDSGGGMIWKPVGKRQSTTLHLSEMKIEHSNFDEEKILDLDEEDVCPICLEEYDIDNPKLIMSSEHRFHLSYILEWMERREACPTCDKAIMLENSFG